MRRINLLYIASVLLLLCGCTKDIAESINDKPINTDGSIGFRAGAILTRGTPQEDLTAYDSIHLIAYVHQNGYAAGKSLYTTTTLTKAAYGTAPNFAWTYSPPMFWPDNKGLSFLAYTSDVDYAQASGDKGVFIQGDGVLGAPVIEYVVPTDVTAQPDLMVCAVIDPAKASNITLPMKHALSCVSFCVTSPITSELYVKNITINGVYGNGTLALDDEDITWTTIGDKSIAFSAGVSDTVKVAEDVNGIPVVGSKINYNYLMNGDGYVMMIPQVLDNVFIEVIYADANGVETTLTYQLPTSVAWEPGKKYIYLFNEDSDPVLVYYEKYNDSSIGFHPTPLGDSADSLSSVKPIIEAGYGVLVKNTNLISGSPTIKLGSGTAIAVTPESISGSSGYTLYAVDQSGTNTFDMSTSSIEPLPVYFDSNPIPCGRILPHFAKGVYGITRTTHSIRTPQQMLNITKAIDVTGSGGNYYQERDLDFAVTSIGGMGQSQLPNSIVNGNFKGNYNSGIVEYDPITGDVSNYILAPKTIRNVRISGDNNIGLFSQNEGTINNVSLAESIILGGSYVGGIVGLNRGTIKGNTYKLPNSSRLTSVPDVHDNVSITATGDHVGGICGYNTGTVIDVNVRGNMTIAGGFLTISSTGNNVGGIAGTNSGGKIGIDGDSFISIRGNVIVEGRDNVGGIVGYNNDADIQNSFVYDYLDGTTSTAPKILSTRSSTMGDQPIGKAGGIVGDNDGNISNCAIWSNSSDIIAVTSMQDYAGGIVGFNAPDSNEGNEVTHCAVYGNVVVKAKRFAGGIIGGHQKGARGSDCWIGNSNQKLLSIINTAITNFDINYTPLTPINSNQSKVPWIYTDAPIGQIWDQGYAGGIAGLCTGLISGIHLNDNVKIGKLPVFSPLDLSLLESGSHFVGGIAGGLSQYNGSNGEMSEIDECYVYNSSGRTVTIEGFLSVGGIVGLNNGIVTNCMISGVNANPLICNGIGKVGGMVGQSGGNGAITPPSGYPGSGNSHTKIANCTVANYVTIKGMQTNAGTATQVGGIVGLNGATNKVENCLVFGAAPAAINISTWWLAGGIAGDNHGDIVNCGVGNTQIQSISNDSWFDSPTCASAGGIAGQTFANSIGAPSGSSYHSDIRNSKVYAYTVCSSNVTGRVGYIVGSINSDVSYTFGSTGQNHVNNSNVMPPNIATGYVVSGLGSVSVASPMSLSHPPIPTIPSP